MRTRVETLTPRSLTSPLWARLRAVAWPWAAPLALILAVSMVGCGGGGSDEPQAVAPPAPPLQTDDSRKASTTVTAEAGGTVETTGADGTVYRLALPPGAVSTTTTISITPLTAANGLPIDRLLAGVRAEPSGLKFRVPLTLTIRLPANVTLPPLGRRAFTVNDQGRDFALLPQRVSGNEVSIPVAHFSAIGLAEFDDWLRDGCDPAVVFSQPMSVAHRNACAQLRPLFDVERARFAAEGGPLDLSFQLDVMAILKTWGEGALMQRIRDAQQAPTEENFSQADDELFDWRSLWLVSGESMNDRQNEAAGVQLGGLIDALQSEYRLMAIARMNAINLECLGDREHVERYVGEVFTLQIFWSFLAGNFNGWEQTYCVNLVIEAFAPPVLVPGQPTLMPVDVRARFTDGVELPGQQIAVTITATDATVQPAGGVLTTPVVQQVTLTPNGSRSTVVISAVWANPGGPWDNKPKTVTLEAGDFASAQMRITSGSLGGWIDDGVPLGAPKVEAFDRDYSPSDAASIELPLDVYTVPNGDQFRASGRVSLARTVEEQAGGVVVVTTTGEAQLLIEPISGPRDNFEYALETQVLSNLCFELETAHEVAGEWTGVVGSRFLGGMLPPVFDSAPAPDGSVQQVRLTRAGEFVPLAAGRWCVGFRGVFATFESFLTTRTSPMDGKLTFRPL